jgi:hypothetical protein
LILKLGLLRLFHYSTFHFVFEPLKVIKI